MRRPNWISYITKNSNNQYSTFAAKCYNYAVDCMYCWLIGALRHFQIELQVKRLKPKGTYSS